MSAPSEFSRTRYISMFIESLPWYLTLIFTISILYFNHTPSPKIVLFILFSIPGSILFLVYRHYNKTSSVSDRVNPFPMTKGERKFHDLSREVACALTLSLYTLKVWWWIITKFWGTRPVFEGSEDVDVDGWAESVSVVLRWFWFILGIAFLGTFGLGGCCLPWQVPLQEMDTERVERDVEIGIVSGEVNELDGATEGVSGVPLVDGEEAIASSDGRTEIGKSDDPPETEKIDTPK